MSSLRGKILLFTLLPLSITIIFISTLTIYNKKETEKNLILNRLNSYRSLLEGGDLSFESLNDIEKLETLLEEKVIYAEIVKKDNTVLYKTKDTDSATRDEADNVAISDAFQGIETIRNAVEKEGSLLEYISPLIINNKIVAALRLELSYERSDMRVIQYSIFVILIGALGLVICYILIALLLNRTVLKNIYRLKESTILIQQGDLNSHIEINSKDEIGDLAQTLEKMRSEVKSSRVSLENSNKHLEEQVKERTDELNKKLNELEGLNKLMLGRELKMIELKNRIAELERKS